MSRIHRTVRDTASELAREFIAERKTDIRRKKANASGELAASYDYDIEQQATQEGISLTIAFLEQGRYIDLLPHSYSHDKWGRNAVSRLEKWIDNRGRQQFIDGWLKRNPTRGKPRENKFGFETRQITDASIINHVVWGILTNRGDGKWRRKKVWNKPKTEFVSYLVNQTIANLLPAASQDFMHEIPTRNQRRNTFKNYAKAKGR
jgi:hypothetical protein